MRSVRRRLGAAPEAGSGATLKVALLGALAGLILSAPAAALVHYTPAPYSMLQSQISGHQVTRAVLNRKAHTVKVTLSDGTHEAVVYPSREAAQLSSQLTSAGATVKVSGRKAVKTAGHRLRYYALAVIVLLGLAGGVLYVLDRRRKRPASGDGESARAAREPGARAPYPAGPAGGPGPRAQDPADPAGARAQEPAAPAGGPGARAPDPDRPAGGPGSPPAA